MKRATRAKGSTIYSEWVIGKHDQMPQELRSLLRVPVAVREVEPPGTIVALRLPSRIGSPPEPPRTRVELWTTDANGEFVEPPIRLRCPRCGEKADAEKSRLWRARHKNKSWVPPWPCSDDCRAWMNRKPPKAERHDRAAREAKDRDGAV